jgi:hypothetical protein
MEQANLHNANALFVLATGIDWDVRDRLNQLGCLRVARTGEQPSGAFRLHMYS